MTRRKDLLANNFEVSRIDWVGAFIRIWVSFNTWYNDNSSSTSEQARVISAAQNPVFSKPYWADMAALNDVAPNDNFSHIVKTVEDLSRRECVDQYGNRQISSTDTTGFKYRLRCNRINLHTDLLALCKTDSELKDWCAGIIQFNTESRKDEIFKELYLGYKRHMIQHMYLPFDAFNEIPKELAKFGVHQFGSVLFHNLATVSVLKPQFVDINKIYGSSFISQMKRANLVSSKTQARKIFPKVGVKGKIYRWHESKGLDLLERELLLLYKLRCSIVHGDRDPKSVPTQKIAKSAYHALDKLMMPLF